MVAFFSQSYVGRNQIAMDYCEWMSMVHRVLQGLAQLETAGAPSLQELPWGLDEGTAVTLSASMIAFCAFLLLSWRHYSQRQAAADRSAAAEKPAPR